MRKSKHSPAPWSVKKGEVFAKNGMGVCVPYCIHDDDRANMKLIAAAPNLLKALKEITDELECQYDMANCEESAHERARIRLIKQARRAISKAERAK